MKQSLSKMKQSLSAWIDARQTLINIWNVSSVDIRDKQINKCNEFFEKAMQQCKEFREGLNANSNK